MVLLMDTVSCELLPWGIKVSVIQPGCFKTGKGQGWGAQSLGLGKEECGGGLIWGGDRSDEWAWLWQEAGHGWVT